MKITKEYDTTRGCSFYPEVGLGTFESLLICKAFVKHFMGRSPSSTKIKVTLSTTNSKKKGFRLVTRSLCDCGAIIFNRKYHGLTNSQRNILDRSVVKLGDSFWMKIEEV